MLLVLVKKVGGFIVASDGEMFVRRMAGG